MGTSTVNRAGKMAGVCVGFCVCDSNGAVKDKKRTQSLVVLRSCVRCDMGRFSDIPRGGTWMWAD